MLLIHQSGSVKVGEVIRYTITYTPSNDRILPTPDALHLKIKNTCAIPLRAAWIHGPYALHVSAYSDTFNPHQKVESPEYGVPHYEPMLKAGGHWQVPLRIPERIRETGVDIASPNIKSGASVTWIVEVASQILFSTSASVDFEIFVGRDVRSLDLGFAAVAGHGHGGPGRLQDVEMKSLKRTHRQTAGVYSKAVRLVVEDTEALWDKPQLPGWAENGQEKKKQKQKKIHLVVVTHGLHSNTGADMLFLKESIDATVKAAQEERRQAKKATKQPSDPSTERPLDEQEGLRSNGNSVPGEKNGTEVQAAGDVNTSQQKGEEQTATAPLSGGQEDVDQDDADDDEELTIVRGFNGNAVKTENGIQYLGKRLAKYILKMTFPDQPFLPVKKSFSRSFTDSFRSQAQKADRDGKPAHLGSSVHLVDDEHEDRPYKFTSISFIGHSLGGLTQTYAIAYIHKHSPTFFTDIKPVNFITMAAPMLGLSNENPMYVKFALDFGLVGRTGQDLGLTWRPPTLARGGWNAMLAGLGATPEKKDQKQEDPTVKPLLRVLPTGPAHHVLHMFRNRTLYSNVVNDGIVPLRTSCLLFLDWRGLGKVEKARRENGLIGTVAGWGWAELTGANMSTAAGDHARSPSPDSDDEHVRKGEGELVPQPDEDETQNDNKILTNRMSFEEEEEDRAPQKADKGMLDSFLSFLRGSPPSSSASSRQHSPSRRARKQIKTLKRAQTVHTGEDELPDDSADGMEGTTSNPTIRPHLRQHNPGQTQRPKASKGDSFNESDPMGLVAPPKTSIFESAGDILHPPLPGRQWIIDPSVRSRTIFHDRVYHPEDIPPPLMKRPSRLMRSISDDSQQHPSEVVDVGGMRIEEKIARAYHRDLSWRKVLVRLEPDAHNNMIVRRMFANAYGWPVVKHLCDTHFANTYSAQTRDEDEPAKERARPEEPVSASGEEVEGQTDNKPPPRSSTDMREARDELTDLQNVPSAGRLDRQESVIWDDAIFEGSDDDNSDIDERGFMQRLINPHAPKKSAAAQPSTPKQSEKAARSTSFVDGHRGLSPQSSATTNPAAVNLTGGMSSPLLSTDHIQAPPATLPAGVTGIGLRRSLEEQVSRSPVSSRDDSTIEPGLERG